MGNGAIRKGFILKARKIEDSDIAHASPCTRELWDLILRKANFRDQRCGRTVIRRGQWLTTYEEIQELLHWRIGYRKLVYTHHQINRAMKALRRHTMIATAKATRGLFVSVLNYDFYQTQGNYEGHNDGHNEGRYKATPQRRNGRNVKKAAGDFASPTAAQVDEYADSIGYHRPNLGRDFVQKYEGAGWSINGEPMRDWRLVVQGWQKADEQKAKAASHQEREPQPGDPDWYPSDEQVRAALAQDETLEAQVC